MHFLSFDLPHIMSFVIVYNISGKSSIPHHTLTGMIGADGLVYWFTKDVANVLGNSHSFGRSLSKLTVKDVAGPLDNVKPRFLRKRLITHDHLTSLLQKARRISVREFGRLLNSPKTQIAVTPGRNLCDLRDPTYLTILKTEEKYNAFFVWLALFKETVLEKLYCQMPVLDDDFVKSFCKNAEKPPQKKILPKPFPQMIVYNYNGRFIKYLPEEWTIFFIMLLGVLEE